jgi:hypothetical protein
MKVAERKTAIAAALWALLAFVVWNVLFDRGVEHSTITFVMQRGDYLAATRPRVDLAEAMRAGIGQSARHASLLALPCAALAMALTGRAFRRGR